MTDQAVTSSTGELLTAVAHLSDEELLLLREYASRLANEFTERSARPRIIGVIRRCGVALAEEQDRRRGLVEYARRQLADGREADCLPGDWYGHPNQDNPCTEAAPSVRLP